MTIAEVCDQQAQQIATLAAKLQEVESDNAALREQVPRWVPVSERLPEPGKPVLISYGSNQLVSHREYRTPDYWVWYCSGPVSIAMDYVTHWCALPPAPAEEG
ncbi:DUF551 domain-containing protein [Parahaliea mediterranea]|uniref:DUF551 domain-containing protein n=1 Tax=Parahaliea mediterranea TaxID=651086 RepID=UPI003BA96D52